MASLVVTQVEGVSDSLAAMMLRTIFPSSQNCLYALSKRGLSLDEPSCSKYVAYALQTSGPSDTVLSSMQRR